MNQLITLLMTLVLSLILSSCGSGGGDSSDSSGGSSSSSSSSSSGASADPVSRGKLVYERPQGNSRFACADCHSLHDDSNDQFKRVGHPIANATRRSGFKNMGLSSFVDAANSCLEEWMRTSIVWDSSTKDYNDLVAYLKSEDDGLLDDPSITYTIADPADANNLEADAMAGQEAFNQTCAYCHGVDAQLGSNPRGISIAGYPDAAFIVNKIRTSGDVNSAVYDGLSGGVMPFWSSERLSDQMAADIAAYLITTEPADVGGGGPTTGGGDCASTHPKIGQQAILTKRQHGVEGTAVIVDDCTIEIQNFEFDGGGLDVRIYTGVNGDYDPPEPGETKPAGVGKALVGPNLVRSNAYNNEKIRVTLPSGLGFNDFDGVSVWCVPFELSFGDGIFM